MNDPYSLYRGDAPLLISIQHLGTLIPETLRSSYTDIALTVQDTDRHLDRLYAFSQELGATLLGARLSRYVIDLNRPPDGESLDPGQTTTGLCPKEKFRGESVYWRHCEPDANEKQRRVVRYWQPYHDALARELARLRNQNSHVLLWEAHSIASVLPRLFDGKLPDLNVGTQVGRTEAHAVEAAAVQAASHSAYTCVANARFKGGYITRRFGAPDLDIHAIQLEMSQSTYMDEAAPFDYVPERANVVQPTLRAMVEAASRAASALPPAATRVATARP